MCLQEEMRSGQYRSYNTTVLRPKNLGGRGKGEEEGRGKRVDGEGRSPGIRCAIPPDFQLLIVLYENSFRLIKANGRQSISGSRSDARECSLYMRRISATCKQMIPMILTGFSITMGLVVWAR